FVKHREHLTTLFTSIIRLSKNKSPWKLDFQGFCLQSDVDDINVFSVFIQVYNATSRHLKYGNINFSYMEE
ncbi:hypothetical protein, partial [Streptococcus sp. HMSC071D03]|uniref:hypothetical protein n=1 Tax=Streptococcus sp. HMSC071D03 TaxID=1739341 RepID=UPI001C99D951